MARVLVTGASGLLGSAIVERLRRERPVWALGHSARVAGTQAIDLLQPAALDMLQREPWTALVHCAAYRNPDFCEQHREAAMRLNAEAPGRLAAIAAARGARMIHISTDYVFDGHSPPYAEDDPTGPVNFYGESKLAGEVSVRRAFRDAVILRVPALWGNPPVPVESAMLNDGIRAALAEGVSRQDDTIARYPTHTRDVAEVVAFLLAGTYAGTLHCGAQEATTRYGWAVAVARALGRSADHIHPMQSDPQRMATRPLDSHLATDRLLGLGAPMPRGFSEWLPEALAEHLTSSTAGSAP